MRKEQQSVSDGPIVIPSLGELTLLITQVLQSNIFTSGTFEHCIVAFNRHCYMHSLYAFHEVEVESSTEGRRDAILKGPEESDLLLIPMLSPHHPMETTS